MSAAGPKDDTRQLPEVYQRDADLRAALRGIEVSAQELSQQDDQTTTAQFDRLAAVLAEEARRLRAILDGYAPPADTFDLGDAIATILAGAQISGLDVSSAVPRGIDVLGRREATAAIVLALLDNVWHHAAPSPVELRATVQRNKVLLHVEDRGPGIPGPLRSRVFEPGARAGHSIGSGHSLATARRLMAEQGGAITFRARPGGGTTFTLHFQRRPSRARHHAGPRRCHIPQ